MPVLEIPTVDGNTTCVEPRGHYRPIPMTVWLLLAALVGYLFIRAETGWSDVAFWYSGISFWHNGQWEGLYDTSINQYAVLPYGPLSTFVLL